MLLISDTLHGYQTGVLQAGQLAVNGTRSAFRQPYDLCALEPAVRLAKEESQYPLLDGRKEGISQPHFP